MNKINFILVLLLLISSCEYEYGNATPKSRSKRDLSNEREQVEKTPEDLLKERLNDTEKSNLDFLKEALGDKEKFNQLLNLDEEKIKSALKHINDELAKCNGENSKNEKTTFKTLIKEYFKSNSNDLDNFKEQTSSTCNGRGS
ncbi:Mlp family lipoprotein [Borrelia puertoricensis]|uniref:Mlp family lipoprotein n=1 Tax=Borrelia puertoricensis TaxID=2756107 RepID=UPI001FF28556|nr:Mlp family lipoprotein [Borrelia puertoricensis]UPA19338.1 Mlp family lipoprotein [Borrelia puertoricensis]